MTSKSQNGIQEKTKVPNLEIIGLVKQIPSLNFGGVHIEIFRSPLRLYSSFQLTSETKMEKNLTENLWCWKKKHIFPLWQTQPLENQNKRTQQNKTTEKLENLYIYM